LCADVGIAVAGQFIEAGAAVLPLLDDAFDAYQFIQGVRRRL
jgi:ubiquinone/menaquinone biosynthesis C-methylase UbiE